MMMTDLEDLRSEWKTLYAETLPQLAKARDPAQKKWPVTLDHCFARIILDNVVGNGEQQWDKLLSKPAVRNMDEQQLQNAIALGMRIIAGHVDLCELDETSLRCRGKNQSKYAHSEVEKGHSTEQPTSSSTTGQKRKANEPNEPNSSVSKKVKKAQSTLDFWQSQTSKPISDAQSSDEAPVAKQHPDIKVTKQWVDRVQSLPSLTAYRKRLYTILLSVPRGRYTTYAAMSDYLKSSARAVGNGIRNNPLAPDVPCHRVLAADGSIGGFHGDWGKDGKYAARKIELLRSEGVKFDRKGKVIGQPFRKFHEFEDSAEDVLGAA